MFTTLLESNRGRPKLAAHSVMSFAFHLALGVGAVHATRRIVIPPSLPQVIPMGPIAPVDRPVAPARPEAAVGPGPALLPSDPIFTPPPVGPIDGIPPTTVGGPIDPSRFVVGSPIPPPCLAPCQGGDPTGVTLFHEDAVDQPAMVVSQPTPEYPAVLKAAQLEGRVVLEFVVDTMGAVEPHSVTVLESTHPGFGRSAVESVLGSRFTPAKIRGAAVRQVVRQGVSFRIER